MISQTGWRRNKAGFTLFEIIVVIALIALLVGISYPRFRSVFLSVGLKTAARSIAVTAKYARALAAREGKATRLFIDMDMGKYWIGIEEDPVRAPGKFEPISSSLARVRNLPRGVAITSVKTSGGEMEGGVGGITFYPDGRAEYGEIHIMQGQKSVSVLINPLTGSVKVRENEG